MSDKKDNAFGMIGLGTMGANLLKNIADHGFSCVGYDKDKAKADQLNQTTQDRITGFSNLSNFINSLSKPRAVMMLVPAGKIVDSVIDELIPLLDEGDIIIDGGNSHFTDTERRFKMLEDKNLHFIGMGVSGGEEGARKGPSMMPGGDKAAYGDIKEILEKIAAHVNGEPTVAFMGRGAAGHFVKMVHNGIEYALMELIAESFAFMQKGLHMDESAIQEVFDKWNKGRLQSFLLEITKDILKYKNPGENLLLLQNIKDEAKSKGTGKWTSQVGMEINLPITVIDVAVSMRDLSKYKDLRVQASKMYPDPKIEDLPIDVQTYIPKLENAFYFSMVMAYAQGMHLLHRASNEYDYGLKLDEVAKIWRGGCIIRSSFLEDIYKAFENKPDLEHLLIDENIAAKLNESIADLRTVVSDSARQGISTAVYGNALSYFDSFRSAEMPANLIQAQRDYFGAHTYELKGKEGTFHTNWQGENK